MSVSERIKDIRQQHGDSLREAAKRTGINYATINRLEKGMGVRDCERLVRQIAKGYGMPTADLLEWNSPKAMFEWRIRRMAPSTRLLYLMACPQDRIRLTLAFLQDHFPALLEPQRLASAAGLPLDAVQTTLAIWHRSQPDRRTALLIAEGLSLIAGISRCWFLRGWFEREAGLQGTVLKVLPQLGVQAQSAKKLWRPSLTRDLMASTCNALVTVP